jgi:hypothetical protein
MTALSWIAGSFVAYRVARWLLAPIAAIWRERPVVVFDEREGRWRAARRLGR